jgi:hypothetical protein
MIATLIIIAVLIYVLYVLLIYGEMNILKFITTSPFILLEFIYWSFIISILMMIIFCIYYAFEHKN